jgi:hypothetical protein
MVVFFRFSRYSSGAWEYRKLSAGLVYDLETGQVASDLRTYTVYTKQTTRLLEQYAKMDKIEILGGI